MADPIGSEMVLFEFALTPTITVPSTNGAKPGKNLYATNIIRLYTLDCLQIDKVKKSDAQKNYEMA